MLSVGRLDEDSRGEAVAALARAWGSTLVARLGELVDTASLDGFVALDDGAMVGVLTYAIRDGELEVVSIQSDIEGRGIGQLLMQQAREVALTTGCRRLWLTTTNDNIRAIRFYQQWGMDLAALHRDGVERSRAVKPSIPAVGHHGIALRHELEFELLLSG